MSKRNKNAGNQHSKKFHGLQNIRDKAFELQNLRNSENNGNEANLQNLATKVTGQNCRNNYN